MTLGEDELRGAWQLLAREEGVFCEPASAAGVAALEQACADVDRWTRVCIVTGHGLKDAGAVDEGESQTVEPTLDAVLEAVG